MGAYNFNLSCTFVLTGWESSTYEWAIFREAISNQTLKFPHPLEEKYYLVNSRQPNMIGFLTPYKGEQYHLDDY